MTSLPGPVVFLGTAPFALPSLRALVGAGERVVLVVTQPDRPRGRGRSLQPPPVKELALHLGLPVIQPDRVNAPEVVERVASLRPEFLVVVAYGQILGRQLLGVPSRGAVNLHPSLLPRHRGPSPVAWTILEGDDRAGVSTMLVDERMDAGPVLLQRDIPLLPSATRGEVEDHLARIGADLVVKTLQGLRAGTVHPVPQDEAGATYSRRIDRGMRRIPWTEPARAVRRRIHALSPRPGALAELRGGLVKVLRAAEVPEGGSPGVVIRIAPEGPVVGCGRDAVVLLEVQPEGKRPMGGDAWARGGGIRPGETFEAGGEGL